MSLSTLAESLKAKATANSTAMRRLEHGLHLLLERHTDGWRLWLWRSDMLPSLEEVRVIRRDFRMGPSVLTETRGRFLLAWSQDRQDDALPATPPSVYQRLQLASLVARGDRRGAQHYLANQTGVDWTGCHEAAGVVDDTSVAVL